MNKSLRASFRCPQFSRFGGSFRWHSCILCLAILICCDLFRSYGSCGTNLIDILRLPTTVSSQPICSDGNWDSALNGSFQDDGPSQVSIQALFTFPATTITQLDFQHAHRGREYGDDTGYIIFDFHIEWSDGATWRDVEGSIYHADWSQYHDAMDRSHNSGHASLTNLNLQGCTQLRAYSYVRAYNNKRSNENGDTQIFEVQAFGEPPLILSQPKSQTVTPNAAAQLSVDVCGSGLAYQWFFNDQPIIGATAAVLNISAVTTANLGPYFLTVSNSIGSTVSSNAMFSLTVPNQPPVGFGLSLITHQNTVIGSQVSATDPDLPPQQLVFSVVTNANKGIAIFTNAITGAFEYKPSPSALGMDGFWFTVSDGLLTSEPVFVSISIIPWGVPTGTHVVVSVPPASLTFSNVITPGDITLTQSGAGQPPPTGFRVGAPPTYFEITTTATYEGPVQVCLSYLAVQYGNERTLRLFHHNGNAWVDVTTSLDTANDIICGNVNSLSPFAIFEAESPLRINNIQQIGPSSLELSWEFSAADYVFTVEFSDEVDGTWQPVENVTWPMSETTVMIPADKPHRLYRVRAEQKLP